MAKTARFGLPLLETGQVQKELVHNEALQRVDMLLAPCVVRQDGAMPPDRPIEGCMFLVPRGAAGEWAGHDDHVAAYCDGGWRYVAPVEGMRIEMKGEARTLRYDGTSWADAPLTGDRLIIGGEAMLAAPCLPIAAPTGGKTIDEQSRTAISAILAALQHHGLLKSL